MVIEGVVCIVKYQSNLELSCNRLSKNDEHHSQNLKLHELFYGVKAETDITLKAIFHKEHIKF